jgi:hypothetical protein
MACGCCIAVRRKDTQIVHLQGYGGRPYHTANHGSDVFDTEVLLCSVRLAINALPMQRFQLTYRHDFSQAQALEHLQGDNGDLEVRSF